MTERAAATWFRMVEAEQKEHARTVWAASQADRAAVEQEWAQVEAGKS